MVRMALSAIESTKELAVAPGSVVVVRDAERLVTSTEMTTSGVLVRVQGLSELVRDSTATFYSQCFSPRGASSPYSPRK